MNDDIQTPFCARAILAKNMRAKRHVKNISQETLADIAGLHRTYIGAIERAQQNVSIDNIEKIAKALSCKVTVLFEEDDA